MKKNKEKTTEFQTTAPENEEIQVIEEESVGKRILNTVVNVILVIAIALAALCTYTSYVASSGNGVPSIFGIRMFSIQTESMYPTLLPGDLIFDTAVKDPGELRNGDIITYWTVINGERVLNTHRIEQIYDGGGYLIFSTKGDNNTSADPLTVHESEVVGKYSFRVETLGKVFDYLQTSTGFLIVVVVPVFLFFLFHLVQFFRVLFEYQNVKNRIKYEQERGRTEDMIAEQKQKQMEAQANARAKMEAELRERLRAEIMASMAAQNPPAPQPAAPVQPVAAPQPAVSAQPVAAPQPVAPVQPAAPVVPVVAPAPAVAPVEEKVEAAPAAAASEEDALLAEIMAEFGDEEKPAQAETPIQEAPAEEKVEEPATAPETPAVEETKAEAPAAEAPKAATPALDEAAIEALIAKQRAAIEAELREKLRAEMLASMNQTPAAPAAETEE